LLNDNRGEELGLKKLGRRPRQRYCSLILLTRTNERRRRNWFTVLL